MLQKFASSDKMRNRRSRSKLQAMVDHRFSGPGLIMFEIAETNGLWLWFVADCNSQFSIFAHLKRINSGLPPCQSSRFSDAPNSWASTRWSKIWIHSESRNLTDDQLKFSVSMAVRPHHSGRIFNQAGVSRRFAVSFSILENSAIRSAFLSLHREAPCTDRYPKESIVNATFIENFPESSVIGLGRSKGSCWW